MSQATLKADCVNKPFAQRCHDLETIIEELPAKVSGLFLLRTSLLGKFQENWVLYYCFLCYSLCYQGKLSGTGCPRRW